ncbi:MAG: helix-turn-helix transcriptional regulator [Lachnospiraceae bacterium]|nr:helix-turn-helix transcriptional regulator [Lachnospiraceae bacterium]
MDEHEEYRFHAIRKKIGKRLRKMRRRKNISQKDLGATIGKSKYCISKYENGKNEILASTIPVLAETCEKRPSYLFEDDEDMQKECTEILYETAMVGFSRHLSQGYHWQPNNFTQNKNIPVDFKMMDITFVICLYYSGVIDKDKRIELMTKIRKHDYRFDSGIFDSNYNIFDYEEKRWC